MMKNVPIRPKRPGSPLRTIVIGRLSKPKDTDEQTEETIESSYAFAERFLADVYQGPLEIRHLGEQISGMVADRASILGAIELIESGQWDLVLAEDLSRIYRNPRHQYIFVQDCVDAGTRLICVADVLDTADDNWKMMLGAATLRHGLYVPDTRRRVRRTATHAFHRGGMVMKLKFGYRKLTREEAATGEFGPVGLRIAKRPELTKYLLEIRRRLMETRCPARVIEWLNKAQVPTGPYVKDGIWKLVILKSLLQDPILHGTRVFRRTVYNAVYRTGLYRRDPNPEPKTEDYPEFAHMTREEQESMLEAVGWEIDYRVTQPKRESPRKCVRRTQSIWPGQAATCAACEGPMLIYGDFLKCKKSLKEHGGVCWNHVQVDLQLTRDLLLQWLLEKLGAIPAAKAAMMDAAWEVIQVEHEEKCDERGRIENEIRQLKTQQANLSSAIALGGDLEGLVKHLEVTENQLAHWRGKLEAAASDAGDLAALPDRVVLEARAPEVLKLLLDTSYDFAGVIREFFPTFMIQPIQTLNSGQVYPRGRLAFCPSMLASDGGAATEVVFDLFRIPDPIRLKPQIVAARARVPRPTLRQIASELDTNECVEITLRNNPTGSCCRERVGH